MRSTSGSFEQVFLFFSRGADNDVQNLWECRSNWGLGCFSVFTIIKKTV